MYGVLSLMGSSCLFSNQIFGPRVGNVTTISFKIIYLNPRRGDTGFMGHTWCSLIPPILTRGSAPASLVVFLLARPALAPLGSGRFLPPPFF